MAIDKIFDGAVDGIADNLFNSVSNSVSEIKAMQQRKAAENVQLVVQALKKIDADIREKYDGVTETIEKRVANIKDGRDGIDGKNGLDGVNGKDGRDGKDGRNGRDGLTGPRGFDGPKGADGKDGRDGEDGVSVTDAHIDFDGSLIISLSSGRVINVGEVVAADIAEKIKVITNGGGTSQPVLDQLASLQAQIDLISSALVYKGTWNASTNTPTLTSSVGTANTFYIVSVAGTTNLNGTSNWGVGDWAVYNGSVWQRIEGGAVGNFTDLSVSGTTTLSGLTASTALALNASKEIVSVTNTGSGNNVLATSPTLVTPVLGTPSSVTLTNATGLPLSTGVTGTLPIANGGTGQTTANTAFNALAPSQTGNSGKYLTTNGTSTSWATVASGTVTSVSGTGTVNGLTLTGTVTTSGSLTLGGTLSGISNASLTNSSITINGTATSLGGSISVGTVTSVAATVPSFLSITGSPITSSGTLAISLSGTALPTTSGGTGLTSFTANGVVYASSSSALTTGSALTFDGSKLVNTGYNKSTYQVSTNTVGTFESVGAAYLSYDSATGASIYSRSNATAENILNLRASTFSFKIGGTQVSSLDSSSFSLYNTPILLSGSTSGYTGFAAPATSNYTIYTLPSSDGTSGQSLVTNGSGTLSWASGTGGTVTSVSGTGTVSGISLSGTVTSSGSLTLGGALDLSAYGGAGAFTTLSASSTVTLSGGTANGVTYLNGSKVLTSGSALTYNGTGLGIGVASASNPLHIDFDGTAARIVRGSAIGFLYNTGTTSTDDFRIQSNAGGVETYAATYAKWTLAASEQMRLTSTGLGIGTSSPSYKLDVLGSARLKTGATGTPVIVSTGSDTQGTLRFGSASAEYSINGGADYLGLIFNVNGSEGMRLTSTGLGIGTNSPSTNLTIGNSGGGNGLGILLSRGATANLFEAYDGTKSFIAGTDSANGSVKVGSLSNHPVSIVQGNGTVIYVDTSTNVGIGTTSPATKLQVSANEPKIRITSTAGSGKSWDISSGGNTTVTLGQFCIYDSTTDSQRFNIASGSGSMLLDGSGNLGLGVTPSAWATYKALQINNGSVANYSPTQDMRISSNAYYNAGWKYIASAYGLQYLLDGSTGSHQWFTAPSGTAGNAITFTQAMTLDASGNLLVGGTVAVGTITANLLNSGTSSNCLAMRNAGTANGTGVVLSFRGNTNAGAEADYAYIRMVADDTTAKTGSMRFETVNGGSPTERARIDSSGNLLVGTTVTNSGISLFPSFSSSGSSGIDIKHQSGAPSGDYFQTFQYNAGVIGSITQNGVSQVLYNISSDQRLKENIQDANSASSLIDALQVRQFDWKADGSHQRYGFVAQELATVYPEAVHQPADTEQMMAVDYSKLVPLLVKEIQSLKARLDAANL